MKKKSLPKIVSPDFATVVPPDPTGKMPAYLTRFEGKTTMEASMQILKEVISVLAKKNSDAEKELIGLFSGIPDTNFDVPEWVKRASQKALETNGFEFLTNTHQNSELSILLESLGKGVGLMEDYLKTPAPPSTPLGKHEQTVVAPVIKIFKQLASEAEPKESAAFFNARGEAEKIVAKFNQPTVRTKIYTLLATRWYRIEKLKISGKLKSTNNLHKFLLLEKGQDEKQILPDKIDSREIRKACESVGLTFQNRWSKRKAKI